MFFFLVNCISEWKKTDDRHSRTEHKNLKSLLIMPMQDFINIAIWFCSSSGTGFIRPPFGSSPTYELWKLKYFNKGKENIIRAIQFQKIKSSCIKRTGLLKQAQLITSREWQLACKNWRRYFYVPSCIPAYQSSMQSCVRTAPEQQFFMLSRLP